MWRRLESLCAALALLAAFGGGYYLRAISSLPLINVWSVLAVVAAVLTFYGITVSIHGHQAHTRLSIVFGFLLSAVVALSVNKQYGPAFLPEAGLLLLTLLCAELRVFTKEPDRRKPEKVGGNANGSRAGGRRAARRRA